MRKEPKMLTNILYKSKLAYRLYIKFSKHYSRAIDFLRRKLNDSIIAIDRIDPCALDSDMREYRSMRSLGITWEQVDTLSEYNRNEIFEVFDFIISEKKDWNTKCNSCYQEIKPLAKAVVK